MEPEMRNQNLEAAIWNLFTSPEFFESARQECNETLSWFGTLAVSRGVANFGRNNQIFETFKKLARDISRGTELARLGDYRLIWDTVGSVASNVRGIMEQPLRSWMSEAEYREFSRVRISRLMAYTGRIESALNNAITGAGAFYSAAPDSVYRRDDDDGFPGDSIINRYYDYVNFYKTPLYWSLPDPLPEYRTDTAVACTTGDEVPWTGVWYPSTGLEEYSLTFAIQGIRMQPVYRVIKTTEELRTDEQMFPKPETLAVETTWYPFKPIYPYRPGL